MPLSTITPSHIPVTVPASGHSNPPSFGTYNTEARSLPPPSPDAPLDSNASTPSSTTSASSESSGALPPTPPPAASFTSAAEALSSTSTRPPLRPASSSTLTLTYSAHTSIPESVCFNPRVTAHPFSFPYNASIATRDYTKPSASNGSNPKASPKRTTATTSGAENNEELEEDAWFFFSANQPSTGLTDVSNSGGEEGNDSLLLFRERQRRYYWLKQVREAQRRKKRRLEEEAEASDSTITQGKTGRRSSKRAKMDSSDARQRAADLDGDVEMASTPPPAGGGRVYSRTLSLRSPSPSSSTSSSRDYGGHRRERSSGKTSSTAAFWGGIGGIGSGTGGVTPAPSSTTSTSGSSARPGTSSGAVSGPGPRTVASEGEGNRFTGSGGIGKGTGQAHTPWSSGNMVGNDEEERPATPPTHASGSATPTIQVNGLTVVKTTSAMTSTTRPRGLWRSSLKASAPVPTVSSTPVQVQGKTQIGGFVFRDTFLGPSLHHQQTGKHLSTAASTATSSRKPTAPHRPQPERGSSRRANFDRIREELSGRGVGVTGGGKRPRSPSVSSCSSSSSSGSSSNCASAGESDGESEVEGRVEHRPARSSSTKTSYRSSSHGQTPPQGTRSQGQNTTAPTTSFDYLGREPMGVSGSGGLAQYSESARGSTTPTLGGLPVLEPEEARNGGKRAGEKRSARGGIRGTSDDEGSDEADISGDLDKKRKQGPQANFQHKRQRTRMQEGTSPIHAAAASAASSSTSPRPKIALTSTGVQRGDVGSEGRKGAKYVTRSKVMDTTSLAGVDPAVMASRKQGATPTTMADSSTSTDASPPHMARPPSPSGYPFPSMHSAHGQPRTPLVTLEDWEDLKEVWNRCLEMVDVEEPEDVLPVLRGIIHECSWFLHEFEDPSVIFMAPRQVTTPTSPPARKPESDIDMSGDSTPPTSAVRPLAHKGPGSTPSSRGGSHPRHRHHHLCQHHENNRHRSNTIDLPTAFHSLLGTALFLFGNIIGANPTLAMDGEPRTSTVYHLYALDVFEVGESLPSKTLVRHDTVTGLLSQGYGSGGYNSGSDVTPPSMGLSSPECCAQGMKEDWQMAVTWGRALVSLAEDLLERQKIVEERNQALVAHAATNPGAAYQLHQQPFENPAAFLCEDFCIPTFMRGGGYFGGTGGEAMGLTLNGMGSFVPVGTGVGGLLSAFHSPSLVASSPGPGDNHWSPGTSTLTRSDSTRTVSSSSTTHISAYASSSSGSSTTTMPSVPNTPVPTAAPRLPAFADSQQQPQSMYPSSSFLSPSFIAASSSRDAFGSGHRQTPLGTPTGGINDPGGYTDPRRLWQEESPFVVIRSRMPPVTRRMSLGVGAGASVDEMMTLAVDQFSRGIFHMPRAVLAGEGNEDIVREGSGLHGHGRHGKHRHHHHHGHHHTHKDEHGPSATTPGNAAVPASFSRASHLYTIAVQVMLLAEKLSNPESRYKWGKYADSVFGQLKLEESPNVEVVSVASESFAGALNYGVGEGPMEVVEEGQRMDVDEVGHRGREEARSGQHYHHHRHGHHHKYKHGHHHHANDVEEGGGMVDQSPSMHAQPHFLNNNSNPDILKARGRCALIIGGALAEESVEGPLEEVLSSFNDDGSGEMDGATSEQVRRVLESEDAVEARERLEEAVKLLERARDVWRKDVWAPRRKARESAKRKRGRARERERQEQELKVKERKEREDKEREQVERAQVEMQKTKTKDNKPGKVKRRGIGKIAADNKRAAAAAISPPSSSASSSFPSSAKGKERAPPATLFPAVSELNTPENEVASTMRVLQSPNTEAPPVSPEPSGSEAATTSPPAMTDYFPLTPAPAITAPDTFNNNTLDEEEEERALAAEEEGEEMEEVDLASLLAEALVMLAELQVEKVSKESMYRRARDEAGRAGKAGLVEEELGEEMNVDS